MSPDLPAGGASSTNRDAPPGPAADIRIGVDVGGTFTDVVLVDAGGTVLRVDKVLTSPERPEQSVLAAVGRVLALAGVPGDSVGQVIHGTTLFANALIERRLARTALVTTEGFRDAVEIAREHRFDMYDLRMRRPEPLAPRHLRFEVRERVLADGSVRTPLDEAALPALAESLRRQAVEAVAVCLLHAYAWSGHERRLGAFLGQALPGVAVSLSSAVAPEIREYERSTTTLANACLQPLAERYLSRLRRQLRQECGITGDLHIMQSNGGVAEFGHAERFPVHAVESGPAAGALAARHLAASRGRRTLLSFDMGGTTAKACMIVDGALPVSEEFEVARARRFRKGSGLPLRVSAVELIEIGTGGGSIAQLDALGRLAAGPESAGADPGPVAYGRGGGRATVTDADLVLGYLDPGFFLGGGMRLDAAAARAAIDEQVARPLGLAVEAAAWAIHQVANESMAAAARVHSVERNTDVSRACLFAFGGAGPVHALGVARILGCDEVVCPPAAGVMSAMGLLAVPLVVDLARSLPGALDGLDWEAVEARFGEMEAAAESRIASSAPGGRIELCRLADLRYRGQGFEVRAELPPGPLTADRAGEVREAFERAYAARYGHRMREAAVEAMTWRVQARGPEPPLALAARGGGESESQKGARRVWLPGRGAMQEVPVHDRYRLAAGCVLHGPLIVEERESTVVVNADAELRLDADGALVIRGVRTPGNSAATPAGEGAR